MEALELVTMNIGGNLHQACGFINSQGLADFVLSLHKEHIQLTTAVLRMPADTAAKLRESHRRWLGDSESISACAIS